MKKGKRTVSLFTAVQAGIFVAAIFTDWFAPLCIIQLSVIILVILDKLGKGILLREVVALHSTFILLLMPLVGYNYYTRANPLAYMWRRYMPVPEVVYFHFALPAVAGFITCLFWPDKENRDNGDALQALIVKAKAVAENKPKIGVYLLVAGTMIFQIANYLPEALRYIFLLFFFSAFAGFLYVWFARGFKGRIIYLAIFAAFILVTATTSGMFTIIAYMSLTLFSFFFLGGKTRLWKKAIWFVLGAFMLLLIQSVKPAFREATWIKNYQGNKAGLFVDLLIQKATTMDLFDADNFFPIYYRTNQGINVSLVMRRFPSVMPFDYGGNLSKVVVSAFVPRVLWPDKPEAGGKFNMLYYTGLYIEGWSTNVGPLGEAYGSFGPVGGIVYMMLLGLFIRWAYMRVFVYARKIPLLIFWLPVLFYQTTYSAETDTLQILNSIFKSAFFVYLLYRIMPNIFVMKSKSQRGRSPVSPLVNLSDQT